MDIGYLYGYNIRDSLQWIHGVLAQSIQLRVKVIESPIIQTDSKSHDSLISDSVRLTVPICQSNSLPPLLTGQSGLIPGPETSPLHYHQLKNVQYRPRQQGQGVVAAPN